GGRGGEVWGGRGAGGGGRRRRAAVRAPREGEQRAGFVGGFVGREAAAVGEQLLELVSVDGEGSVAPGARPPVFLGEREPPAVDDDRVRPVVLRHDVTLRGPDRAQVGGGAGELPDAVERARRPGRPRDVSAAWCRLRRNLLAHGLDLLEVALCLGVALELVVDGPDGAAQRGEVGRGGGEKAHPPAAQDRGV